MQSLRDAVDQAAEHTGFSGVVRLDRSGRTVLSTAYGLASLHQPSSSTTYTVISNWSAGAWPLVELLDDRLGT
jgi:hypothetical protein